MRKRFTTFMHALMVLLLTGSVLTAAKPTTKQALSLKPVQAGIEYDRPTGEELAKCRVAAIRDQGLSGWMVLGSASQTLRRFVDSNKDNRIDQWCYFLNGIEVYRDIDSDHNGKAEQYRWLGTAGSRWGLDTNEDGVIDRWKEISPEEVTAEVVAALRDRDEKRFRRILLTKAELKNLSLGSDQASDLEQRITAAHDGFRKFVQSQKLVGAKSKWLHFGATRPGVIPAGTAGSKRDLVLYDHAAAIVETNGKHGQVIVGTLVRVGASWRVIDLPRDDAATGLFYTAIEGQSTGEQPDQEVGLNREMQDLLERLEKVDKKLESPTNTAELGTLNAERADVLEQLVQRASSDKDRQTWVRQFADTVSAAVQTGGYPEGVARLKAMSSQLTRDKANSDLQAYVKFRFLTAEYGQQIQKPNADFTKIQERWLANLASFVKRYPKASDAAEAMLQLAIAQEFAGKESKAAEWYSKIAKGFPQSTLAKKAQGAKRRLASVGKPFSMQGKSLMGDGNVDLVSLRGSVVLLHYWATWCEPCKQDMEKVKALRAKFGGKFVPVGINVDHDRDQAVEFVRSKKLTWPQMHEDGGLESRLATELGVLTLPTMLLIDAQGKVLRRNVHVAELEEEIKKQIQ